MTVIPIIVGALGTIQEKSLEKLSSDIYFRKTSFNIIPSFSSPLDYLIIFPLQKFEKKLYFLKHLVMVITNQTINIFSLLN